jgi:basic membrane lipoprotein Med (substrate-binding protein (PBP1-ABC) superfamily)/DNA-binding SARP family transcriptional activator
MDIAAEAGTGVVRRMRYRILGPLEVIGEEGPVSLGPPKQRELLALLLLSPGQPVSVSSMIEHLWGESSPRTAEHAIQTYVSALRAQLGADVIITTRRGYRIDVEGGDIDILVFEELSEATATALAQGDADHAFELARQALDVWRGPPLEDVGLFNGTHPRAVHLTELHLQTVERWAEAAIGIGNTTAVLTGLEQATLEHPLRESLWAWRMQALHAEGRDAEALRVYQDLRRILGDELGVEPSQRLQLLEERLLLAEEGASASVPMRNPYKGLRPFGEGDAADFFGRDQLIRELVAAVEARTRPVVVVVGPSGGGKSSVVRAGLLPRLRSGAVEDSSDWEYVVVQPGPHPFETLKRGLATDDLSSYPHTLQHGVLLVLDQFEELFTQSSANVVSQFLQLLTDWSSHPLLRIVVTLRADFYDRPMLHPTFGRVFVAGVVNAHPLTPEQLAAAASGPAARMGVRLEPALMSELIRDVAARPGSLPLFQYALTEVFDRRGGALLTLDSYRAAGGVAGAVTRRAEELYGSATTEERDVMRQLFFRLVAVGEGDQVTRRRVSLSEVHALRLSPRQVDEVVERLVQHRLVSLDREPASGEPTVEVAHEALLTEWDRLRGWLDDARSDLRQRVWLAAAREEWMRADGDPGFLLTGRRLEQYEEWADRSTVALTSDERGFLERSIAVREEEAARIREADAELRHHRLRWRVRRWAAAAVAAVLVAVLAVSPWESPPPRVAAISGVDGDLGVLDLFSQALTTVEEAHGVEFTRLTPLIDVNRDVQELCRAGTDLIVIGLILETREIDPSTAECAETMFMFVDFAPDEEIFRPAPNLAFVTFGHDEGSYLAGVAAALTTQTGVVGFVGGQRDIVTPFLAGFEGGVHAVDPEVEVLAIWTESFDSPHLGRNAATSIIARRADVVFHAAGASGHGVRAAVAAANEAGTDPVWYIGVDVDEALSAPPADRPYVLTSMLKRLDVAVGESIDAYFEGELAPGIHHYGLTNGGVELTKTGGHLEQHWPRIEEMRLRLIAGGVPIEPWRVVDVRELPLPADTPTHRATAMRTGGTCRYEGPTQLVDGDVLAIDTDSGTFGVRALPGAEFRRQPIPTGETLHDFDLESFATDPEFLVLPVFSGTWWVGCMTEAFAYPAAVIEVTER